MSKSPSNKTCESASLESVAFMTALFNDSLTFREIKAIALVFDVAMCDSSADRRQRMLRSLLEDLKSPCVHLEHCAASLSRVSKTKRLKTS